MSGVSRTRFTSTLDNHAIDVHDPKLVEGARSNGIDLAALDKADGNTDGLISGQKALGRLYDAMDALDRRAAVRTWLLSLTACMAVVSAGVPAAEAGPAYSLGRKAVCAETAVELDVTFEHSPVSDRLVERSAAARRAFPAQVRARAISSARVANVLYGTPARALPNPMNLYVPDRVWREAYRRGRLRALLFLRHIGGRSVALFGVEGVPNDIASDYSTIRAAVVQYGHWREELQGNATAVSEAENMLATTPNAAVATLASNFLCSIGRTEVVARTARAARTSPASIECPSQPVNCTDW